MVRLFAHIHQTIKRLAVNQRLQIGADQHIGRRLTGFTVPHHPDRVVRPGSHLVAHIGFKGQIAALLVHIHRHKRRIIHRDADLFDRRDQHIFIAVAAQDGRKQLHQRRPPDGRTHVKPRPVPRDPHIDLAAMRRVPQMHRRDTAFLYGTRARCEAFRRRRYNLLCGRGFCHWGHPDYLVTWYI